MSKTKKRVGKSNDKAGVDGISTESPVKAVADIPSEVPSQPPPPPPIAAVIAQLATGNLRAAFGRIADDIQGLIVASGLAEQYNFLFLYDEQSSISERTSNRLYSAASGDFAKPDRPHFLLLHTRGGLPVPAFLISRYLKTSTDHGFIAVVPRRSKSAGTLIALGARQIHMGLMSELGPIDPQYSDFPALGLGSALDHIAGVCEKHPGSAAMLATYLQGTLNIHHLGFFERISESAAHYAERLLRNERLGDADVSRIAMHLVYGYKDHSFAIDCDEIRAIFGTQGEEVVKTETPEYKLANQIHQYMEQVNFACHTWHKKYCSISGRVEGLELTNWRD